MSQLTSDQFVGVMLLLVAMAITVRALVMGQPERARGAQPTKASGFTRWLTPMGMSSVLSSAGDDEPASRTVRKSTSMKAIKVRTPVSRIATKVIAATNRDPREIARRTGLSRDAVTLMLASTEQRRAPRGTPSRPTKVTKTITRAANDGRAMSAPGARTAEPVRADNAVAKRALGTRFNARLS
jgi:hypothetical protein